MKKLVDINEILTYCLTYRQTLANRGENIPNWLLTYPEDLKFRIKMGVTKEYVSQVTLDELKIKDIDSFESENISNEIEETENSVKIKKEYAIKAKRIPRKETALSYMRELILEIEDDEMVASKILERFPGSTYTKHMVKFQRKKNGEI